MPGHNVYINGKKLFVIIIAYIVLFFGSNIYYAHKAVLESPSVGGAVQFFFTIALFKIPKTYLFIGVCYWILLKIFHRYFDYSLKSYVYIGILSSIVNATIILTYSGFPITISSPGMPVFFIAGLIKETISFVDNVIHVFTILNFPTGFIFVMLYWFWARPDKHSLKPTKTDA